MAKPGSNNDALKGGGDFDSSCQGDGIMLPELYPLLASLIQQQ